MNESPRYRAISDDQSKPISFGIYYQTPDEFPIGIPDPVDSQRSDSIKESMSPVLSESERRAASVLGVRASFEKKSNKGSSPAFKIFRGGLPSTKLANPRIPAGRQSAAFSQASKTILKDKHMTNESAAHSGNLRHSSIVHQPGIEHSTDSKVLTWQDIKEKYRPQKDLWARQAKEIDADSTSNYNPKQRINTECSSSSNKHVTGGPKWSLVLRHPSHHRQP